VQIENLDFEKCLLKYDSPNTLFYLDPPYVDVEHYYNRNGVCFGAEDHKRLASLLSQIQGKFVLSYYEHELVRKYYKKFEILTKTTSKHSCGITRVSKSKKKPKAVELLIKNY
jgi:DNA adenine methylase